MKRRYQIDRQRAVQQFRQLAREQNPNIQMIFPMAEVVGLLQEGVGHLLREAGLALMNLVMEEEVRHLAGERHQQHPERRAHRWGKEDGYCVVDGQKVPIRRTRLRSPEHREQRLGSYELFQRSAPLEQSVWDKMMRGLSTRNYGAVVKDFREAYGVEKSAVSDSFIEASREKLQELMERPLGELQLCAVLIDGTPFRDRQMIVALGINIDGRKTVLGLREGATENATVVGELLSDLAARGLDFRVPRLYVLDGGKALQAAVRFYNKRGTAEQWIKEGRQAVKMTRLSCHRFRSNQVRLALSLLAYNLGNLWRRLALPRGIENWSLTSLQQRLVKTGGRLVKHARYYWLLLAEGHLNRRRFGAMLGRIALLPVPTG